MGSPEQALRPGQRITIPAGTEFSFGKHKDGDFVVFIETVTA